MERGLIVDASLIFREESVETPAPFGSAPRSVAVIEIGTPFRRQAEAPEIPSYLRDVYYWAYLNPRNVKLLDREIVVSVILRGQPPFAARRLRRNSTRPAGPAAGFRLWGLFVRLGAALGSAGLPRGHGYRLHPGRQVPPQAARASASIGTARRRAPARRRSLRRRVLLFPYLLIRDTPPVGMYVLNMFCMRGSRLWGSRLHRACVV